MNQDHTNDGRLPYQPALSVEEPASKTQGSSTPPLVPSPITTAGNNPYEFIMNAEHKPQRSFLGGSLKARLLVILVGLGLLAVIAAVAMTLLKPKDSATTLAVSLVQEQQELMRIADLGAQSATSQNARNSAITVSTSIANDQTSTTTFLTSHNIKIDPKQMAAKYDSKTDKLFADAKASSTFDTVWKQTMTTKLTLYQTDLRALYNKTQNKSFKNTIEKAFDSTKLLLELLSQS